MMLRPSYSDLLEVVNEGKTGPETIGSRYTIVIAAAKRARELVDHRAPLINNANPDKPVSVAVEELYAGKIKIVEQKEEPAEYSEENEYDAFSDNTPSESDMIYDDISDEESDEDIEDDFDDDIDDIDEEFDNEQDADSLDDLSEEDFSEEEAVSASEANKTEDTEILL
ncbi:MAG: DNA-directed RNA polymerase subunit omega [Firmicutes bacterium]|nr:DNA-directed RNA polymerase subunit omega [Bacillota bacterium]